MPRSKLEQVYTMDSGSEEEEEVDSGSEENEDDVESEDNGEEEDRDSGEEGAQDSGDSEEDGGDSEGEAEEDDSSEGEDEEENEDLKGEDDESLDSSKKESKASMNKEEIPFNRLSNSAQVELLDNYAKKKGKTLYVRFPHNLTKDEKALEDKLKGLCSLIVKVRRPRQPSVRFCLVDFDNTEDRAQGLKELKEVEVDGHKLHVEIAKTECEEFIWGLIEKRAEKKAEIIAQRKIRMLLNKQNPISKVFTSTILVGNIPPESTIAQISNIFPTAVDIKLNPPRGYQDTATASVTLPTPQDATKVRRMKNILGGNVLSISYAVNKKPNYGQPKFSQPNSMQPKFIHPKSLHHKQNFEKNGQPELDSPITKKEKRKIEEQDQSTESSAPKKIKKVKQNKEQEESGESSATNSKEKKIKKKLKDKESVKKANGESATNTASLKSIKKKKSVEKIGTDPQVPKKAHDKQLKKEKSKKPHKDPKKAEDKQLKKEKSKKPHKLTKHNLFATQ